MDFILGLDVGKTSVHAALLIEDKPVRRKSIPNTKAGFSQFDAWLKNREVAQVHACIEAGGYVEALALHLHGQGHTVSLVNPSRVKAFGESDLIRTKTDAVDAALIARFCRVHRPLPWEPPAPEILALQRLVRRLESLKAMTFQERNRLERTDNGPVVESIESVIVILEQQSTQIESEIDRLFKAHPTLKARRDLLTSIPGIGDATAAKILGEVPTLDEFSSSKSVAAYAGLSPRHFVSGSIHAKSRLSKVGNGRLRKALYFPAMVAIRWNPILKAFARRLALLGKPKLVIIAAVMRKLLVIAYGVLKSGTPWDPQRATPA
jgi:transposase